MDWLSLLDELEGGGGQEEEGRGGKYTPEEIPILRDLRRARRGEGEGAKGGKRVLEGRTRHVTVVREAGIQVREGGVGGGTCVCVEGGMEGWRDGGVVGWLYVVCDVLNQSIDQSQIRTD